MAGRENGRMRSHRRFGGISASLFASLAILTCVSVAPGRSAIAISKTPKQETPKRTLAQRSTVKVIDTPDPKVKWRITGSSFVERTTDGGSTWRGQQVNAHEELLAGSAPSAKVCWVVGRDSAIYVTKDAQKWEKVDPPISGDLIAVSAKSARSATVTAADDRTFDTHDGGRKWKDVNRGSNESHR